MTPWPWDMLSITSIKQGFLSVQRITTLTALKRTQKLPTLVTAKKGVVFPNLEEEKWLQTA